jgi:cellular nucleic acid-binding protein
MSRECPKPKDWSRVKCTNCSKYGHGKMRCPEPEATGDSYGGGGNGWDAPTDTGAATGGWYNATVEPATTGGWVGDDLGSGGGMGESWADQTTAEAQW